jgi:hypothetical protein
VARPPTPALVMTSHSDVAECEARGVHTHPLPMLSTATRASSALLKQGSRGLQFNAQHLTRASLADQSVVEIITDSSDPVRDALWIKLRGPLGG